ncbi:MBL fold metallo-hydrolase [Cellulomonas shaoxiangyii]|uniref:MBL fold metallo-hydrolase n=1 Tax=Cellulomonas shaoxiangyii TaxID=2566013 RepID=A0A4P7SNB4_9CELL|nr:MBL fold metallo-hydrolase [Cellulomonas shaoxiangyii]QCB94093.1 MBL fold metallo-hydrolase [Cellulomonas shaoxiangyii]TGY83745.1 MBL fold metallo-hydrolase [Cellulomonas shaoxiangyii]
MRLVVLGSAGSFPAPDSAASSYLVQAEDADGRTWSVVLDLGNGALGPLQRYGDPTALDAVALSHLHADHVADMAVLGVLRRYHPAGALPPLRVLGPEGTVERLAQLAGKDPATHTAEQFAVEAWAPGRPVTVGPLTLEPVPVVHPIPAFGMRVTGPSEDDPARTVTLAYSGDTDACPGLDALATDADVLLAEAAYVEGRDDHLRGVHLTGRRAGEAAARGGARRLVLTHIPAWNDPHVPLAEASAAYAGPVTLAQPGLTIPL